MAVLTPQMGSFERGYLGDKYLREKRSRVWRLGGRIREMLSFWEGSRERRGCSGGGRRDELRCDFEFGERLRFSESQDMNDLEELIDIHGFFQDGYGAVL